MTRYTILVCLSLDLIYYFRSKKRLELLQLWNMNSIQITLLEEDFWSRIKVYHVTWIYRMLDVHRYFFLGQFVERHEYHQVQC